MAPLLSINIPTYNRASYLTALVDSMAECALALGDKIEINVLDNASPDGTAEAVQALQQRLPIHYIRHPENIGGIANIHQAHRVGTGRYVWVLGDDDYLLPSQLRRIVEKLEQGPGVLLLSYARCTPDGRRVGEVQIGNADRLFTKNSPDFKLAEVDSMIGFISANIVERKWIEAYPAERYDALDEQGELGHAIIFYAAIAAGSPVQYLAGCPLVQTIDNGYLKHETWMHVCVRYCVELPKEIIKLGFAKEETAAFFSKRIRREVLRRALSEKYRKKQASVIDNEPIIKSMHFTTRIPLKLILLTPGALIRFAHNLIGTKRS